MFPGPVVVTTNCVIEALKSYRDRLYTLNETGVPGVKHLDVNNDDDLNKLLQVWSLPEHAYAQNMYCGFLLELPHSNKYPQFTCMFQSRNKKQL